MKKVLFTLLLSAALPVAAMANELTTGAQTSAAASVQTGASTNLSLSSSQIMDVQRELQSEGLYQGAIDGVWGPISTRALQQYQSRNNLQATGALNNDTLSELGVDADISGSKRMDTTGSYGSRAPVSNDASGGVRADTRTNSNLNVDTDADADVNADTNANMKTRGRNMSNDSGTNATTGSRSRSNY